MDHELADFGLPQLLTIATECRHEDRPGMQEVNENSLAVARHGRRRQRTFRVTLRFPLAMMHVSPPLLPAIATIEAQHRLRFAFGIRRDDKHLVSNHCGRTVSATGNRTGPQHVFAFAPFQRRRLARCRHSVMRRASPLRPVNFQRQRVKIGNPARRILGCDKPTWERREQNGHTSKLSHPCFITVSC